MQEWIELFVQLNRHGAIQSPTGLRPPSAREYFAHGPVVDNDTLVSISGHTQRKGAHTHTGAQREREMGEENEKEGNKGSGDERRGDGSRIEGEGKNRQQTRETGH